MRVRQAVLARSLVFWFFFCERPRGLTLLQLTGETPAPRVPEGHPVVCLHLRKMDEPPLGSGAFLDKLIGFLQFVRLTPCKRTWKMAGQKSRLTQPKSPEFRFKPGDGAFLGFHLQRDTEPSSPRRQQTWPRRATGDCVSSP